MMLFAVLRVFVVAVSLALDVFAVSIGVGIRGTPPGGKLRIGLAFAGAEVVMNVIGASIGALIGNAIGDVAAYIGFAALVGIGVFIIIETLRAGKEHLDLSKGRGLALASLSISLDSLGVGFSIFYLGVSVAFTLFVVACVSVAATMLGLTFGRALGERAESRAGVLGGIALIGAGLLFAALKYYRIG
jgi:putative Mn2+ efflux pump MntP